MTDIKNELFTVNEFKGDGPSPANFRIFDNETHHRVAVFKKSALGKNVTAQEILTKFTSEFNATNPTRETAPAALANAQAKTQGYFAPVGAVA